MSIISTAELQRQAITAVTDRNFEAILVSATRPYSSATTYASFAEDEVSTTAGGYTRIPFTFDSTDITTTATGVSTFTKYLTWFHDGSSNAISFDNILIVEREFAQPLNLYSVVGVYNVGVRYTLRLFGERARFSLRFNIKNK